MLNEVQKYIINTLSERSLQLRKISPGDAAGLAEFYDSLSERSRFLFVPHSFELDHLKRICERFAADIRDRGFVLLDESNHVAAYFFLWHIDMEVPELGICIGDHYQGKGIGKLLMQFLIEEGRNLNKKRLRLTTEESNCNAFALYQKCGFVYTETLKITDEKKGIVSYQKEMFYTYQDQNHFS